MPSASQKVLSTYLPISPYQERMIELATLYPADYPGNIQKIIRWAFRVRPGIPERKLKRAFDKLVARHESLRMHFVEVAGSWKAEVRPTHPNGLFVEDLRHLDPTEQERVIRERAEQPMYALSPALFEMYLMQCGEMGDVVMMRLQHSVGDGYSAAILIEELMKILLMLPLGPAPASHMQFVKMRNSALADRKQEKDRYWRSKLLPLPKDLNIGRTAKGLPPQSIHTIGETRKLNHFLEPTDFSRLQKLSDTTGVTIYCYLMVAYAETICALGGGTEVLITSTFGRSDKALANFVGAELKLMSTRYIVNPTDLAERAAWFSQQLIEGAKFVPSDVFDNPKDAFAKIYEDANQSYRRFIGNFVTPSGRFANSPFKKFFGEAMTNTAHFSTYSFEQVHLPKQFETAYELNLVFNKLDAEFKASLVADALGYSEAELSEIGQGIRQRILECFEKQGIAG